MNSTATQPRTRRHYFTDNECGGVRQGQPDSLAFSTAEVNCGECIGMMYDQGILTSTDEA